MAKKKNILIVISVIFLAFIAVYLYFSSRSGLGARQNNAYLSRTAEILRNSRGPYRPTFKILFYGQSITDRKWTDQSAGYIRDKYKNVNIVYRNLAIGGNSATLLERAAARDMEDFYPDLVVFHVYGDEHAYERIVRLIRSQTAAEIILQTDHIISAVEPVCPHGIRRTLDVPRGCVGKLWLRQRNWDDYMSGSVIPAMSEKYHAAIDDRRRMWQFYISKNNIPMESLLRDGVHPNDKGWTFAANLFNRSFDRLISASDLSGQSLTRDYPAASIDGDMEFVGNRVEIVTSLPLKGPYQARLDDTSPMKIPGCWQLTRTSSIGWIPEWPAIRQIGLIDTPLEADEWTAQLSNFTPNLENFKFSLHSKRHGFDGEGIGSKDFLSASGRVSIKAEDWAFGYAQRVKPQPRLKDAAVRWSRRFACDRTSVIGPASGGGEYRYVIATGLDNGPHHLRLKVDPADRAAIRRIVAFKPPLVDSSLFN